MKKRQHNSMENKGAIFASWEVFETKAKESKEDSMSDHTASGTPDKQESKKKGFAMIKNLSTANLMDTKKLIATTKLVEAEIPPEYGDDGGLTVASEEEKAKLQAMSLWRKNRELMEKQEAESTESNLTLIHRSSDLSEVEASASSDSEAKLTLFGSGDEESLKEDTDLEDDSLFQDVGDDLRELGLDPRELASITKHFEYEIIPDHDLPRDDKIIIGVNVLLEQINNAGAIKVERFKLFENTLTAYYQIKHPMGARPKTPKRPPTVTTATSPVFSPPKPAVRKAEPKKKHQQTKKHPKDLSYSVMIPKEVGELQIAESPRNISPDIQKASSSKTPVSGSLPQYIVLKHVMDETLLQIPVDMTLYTEILNEDWSESDKCIEILRDEGILTQYMYAYDVSESYMA